MWRVLRARLLPIACWLRNYSAPLRWPYYYMLAQANTNATLRDVILVFALLAAMIAVAFVRRAWSNQEANHKPK